MNQVILDRLTSRGPLADWEIHQLSAPPCGFFQYYLPIAGAGDLLRMETVEEPCWLSGAAREQRRMQIQAGGFSTDWGGRCNESRAVTWRDFDPSKDEFRPMIEPFIPQQVRQRGGQLIDPPENEPPREPFDYELRSYRAPIERVISYGLSSFGYDVRVADEFKVFTNINSTVVDPKNFDENNFVEVKGKGYCIIPPNSFALGRTMERFRIPRDILTVCLGKSTYARCGIIVNVTPFEPEWEGYVTLEFSNTTPLPAKIYAEEGVAQVVFLRGNECQTSYADRNGKYMNQPAEVVTPRT